MNRGSFGFGSSISPVSVDFGQKPQSGQVLISQGDNDLPFVPQSLPAGIGTWQKYTSGTSTFTAPRSGYFRFYAFGAGGTAAAIANTSAASGGGGGCAYGDIYLNKGQKATIVVASAYVTVSVNGVTLLTANAGGVGNGSNGGFAGTATKDASVLNGGAFSGGAGVGVTGTSAAVTGGSAGSPLGVGKNGNSASSSVGATVTAQGRGVVGDGGLGAWQATGAGRDLFNRYTDPLLVDCIAPCPTGSTLLQNSYSGDGAGGSQGGGLGGAGGFMGGGSTGTSYAPPVAGDGGFGSSGAAQASVDGCSAGLPSYGAGGSAACAPTGAIYGTTSVKAGGAAICLVYY